MNEFTASNGTKFRLRDGYYLDSYCADAWVCMGSDDLTDALREFFQNEADEKAGIWRSKIDPAWTAKVVDDHVHFHHKD